MIEVRPAGAADAEAISVLVRDAIRRVNSRDYPPHEIARLLQGFSPGDVLGFLEDRDVFVAVMGGEVVGTGALKGAEIKSVFVSPDRLREGIGRAVMQTLERLAAVRGIEALEVASSLSAIRFYAALGYGEQGRRFYKDEETVIMVKPLVGPAP